MKTYVTRILAAVSLGFALGPASVLAQSPLHANIPFDFTVGNQTFAAGEYRVAPVGQCLRIQAVNRPSTSMLIMTQAGSPGVTTSARSSLTFNRYGDRYFLSRVAAPQLEWDLAPSSAEKEAIAKLGSPRPVLVANSRSR